MLLVLFSQQSLYPYVWSATTFCIGGFDQQPVCIAGSDQPPKIMFLVLQSHPRLCCLLWPATSV
jgi:hypothetical protein